MKFHALSPLLICILVATQVIGPAMLWAAEERSIRIDESRRVVIAAIDGTQLTARNKHGNKPLRFRDVVHVEEQLDTGARTQADLLIGNRAVVTMGNDTALQLLAVHPENTTIQVTKGMVRVAAAASALGQQGVVTVQTPTGQVQTRGGIVRVLVETPVGKAEPVPMGEAKAYRASHASEQLLVAASARGEFIQVEEGAAEILEAGGKTVMIQSGQSVSLQAGKAGMIGESGKHDRVRSGIVAMRDHSQTPKEGRDYLVALQVDQARQLGDKLTKPVKPDPKDSKQEESEKKSNAKDVINGATGGVTLQNNLVSALFGDGRATNSTSGGTIDRTGSGYGGNNSQNFEFGFGDAIRRTRNGGEALLVFTRKDSIEPLAVIGGVDYKVGDSCDFICLLDHQVASRLQDLVFNPFQSDSSRFTLDKELVLIGGSQNISHGGKAPDETLIVRGLVSIAETESITNRNLDLHDSSPVPDISDFRPPLRQIVNANSNLVVENKSLEVDLRSVGIEEDGFVGGTLGQFSLLPDLVEQSGIATIGILTAISQVDGAITATGAKVALKGGVTLDQETTSTIGTTLATNTYFTALPTTLGRKFSGSLLSVIRGPNNTPTSLTMQDRMLGVYDGSMVKSEGENKALLSVLDAKLKGPSDSLPLIDIAAGTHFDRDGKPTPGSSPNVTVTSAVVTRSTIPLDSALLEASAPLIALTKATMTTTNHFADLAGNQAQSLNLNGALVALNASKLVINSGHLLNLNNATAAISGYLFSLTNGSALDISNGALFSLNDSSLALKGAAFGVFGSGSNTLTIENNLCTGSCGRLVNSANQPILLDGVPLKVSGVTQDVALPNGFNAFALAPGATAANAKIDIDANDALFHIDPTSTLTINGTKVH